MSTFGPDDPAPVSAPRLLVAAWRTALQTLPALWPVWVLNWLFVVANDFAIRALRPEGAALGGDLRERFTSGALAAFGGAVVGALAMPVLLGRQAHPGGLRREHGPYLRGAVLVSVGFTVAIIALGSQLATLPPDAGLIAMLALLVIATLASAPWALWLAGQLPGDERIALMPALRAGAGGAGSYAAASLIVGLPPTLAYWVASASFDGHGDLPSLALAGVFSTFCAIWDFAVSATFFRQRLGLDQRDVAEMFD